MNASKKGLRRNWIRIPLSALLLWIASIAIPQGWDTLTTDDDWSDDYIRGTAVIVAGREELVSSVTSNRSAYYRCHPIVEYAYRDETHRVEPIWLREETYSRSRDGDCAAARFGEEMKVWIQAGAGEPSLLQVGNKTSQPISGIVNILTGLLALFGVKRLWLGKSYGRARGKPE